MNHRKEFQAVIAVMLAVLFLVGCGGTATQLPGTPVPGIETDLSAGPYRTPDNFAIPFTFEIGQDWQGLGYSYAVGLWGGENSIGHANVWISFLPLSDRFQPDEVIAELRATEKLESGEIVDVSYHGFEARQFESQAQPNLDNKGGPEIKPGTISLPALEAIVGHTVYSESPQAKFRFTFVEVRGKTLLIAFEAPQEQYEALLPEIDQILNSIEFTGQ
jgi:hypothetical protein